MKDSDLYMTAALCSFVTACIAGLATLTGPHWMTGSLVVALFALLFTATFRLGLAARQPSRPRMTTREINLARLQRLSPAGAH